MGRTRELHSAQPAAPAGEPARLFQAQPIRALALLLLVQMPVENSNARREKDLLLSGMRRCRRCTIRSILCGLSATFDHSPEEPILARPELSTWTSSEHSGRCEFPPRQTLMQVNKINSQNQSRDRQISYRPACARRCRERRARGWTPPRRAAASLRRAAAAALRARARNGMRP